MSVGQLDKSTVYVEQEDARDIIDQENLYIGTRVMSHITNPTMLQEDVVITGVACRLPQSDNMAEFKENLLNGVDMVTESEKRWKPAPSIMEGARNKPKGIVIKRVYIYPSTYVGLYGLPKRNGILKDLTKFDAEFFGVHPKQANTMDPQLRNLLEVTYEAIVDAGVTPETIRGSNTGVFIGAIGSECHEAWSADLETTEGYTMTGCAKAMLSNRISFFFDFKGPSYTLDTACSSSLLALDHALHSIRSGLCEAAIVGGSNLCLKPAISLQFLRLGMLSPEGMCKSFDEKGNGYCRSEGIVAMYIQQESVAKRIYCTIVHSKTSSDGHKLEGVTYPSGEMQKKLLREVYSEANVNPLEVAYVEAHGTGTKAGDTEEVNTICDVFCQDRQSALPIGSVKSNMGHCEPTSGLAAIARVIVAMEEGIIPGNLHYNSPNPDIPGLQKGHMHVVTDNLSWQGGLVGVNSFGFGGTNVHALLKSNSRKMVSSTKYNDKRLFLYSSRTIESLKATLQEARQYQDNLDLHSLMNETVNMSPESHPYRGFTILNGSEHISVQRANSTFRPVWYMFPGMGCQWFGMGRDMMKFDVFKKSILRSDSVLQPVGVHLYNLLMDGQEGDLDDTTNSFVAIAAIQVALVDTLTTLGIRPDGIIGHSVGELGCAYADGCLTAEETILAAYWRGYCIKNANLAPGGMAAVGLTWKEALEQCPADVVPACHNAKDTVTVSGPRDAVKQFVEELKQKQVFAREVNTSGVAFHSHYMNTVAPALKTALDKVIQSPRPRTSRWISSSIKESDWTTDMAKFSSSDYHVNNLVSPVLFQEALQHVPEDAIIIEIAPHGLLQTVLKRSVSRKCCIVGLMNKNHDDNVEFFLTSLGRCYQEGVMLNPLKLCPPVSFPVPAGTPFISPMVKWNHLQTWDVPAPEIFQGTTSNSYAGLGFDFNISAEDSFLIGHNIDGRVLFPATGYLVLAWKTLAKMENIEFDQLPVQFEDFAIKKATLLPEKGKIHFHVTMMPGTGNFEIIEGGTVVASGRVFNAASQTNVEPLTRNDGIEYALNKSDIYKELRLRGYDYGPSFKGIIKADLTGVHGESLWEGEWITFLDTLLQMILLSQQGYSICLPTRIKTVTIDPVSHLQAVKDLNDGTKGLPVRVDRFCDNCKSGGVIMQGINTSVATRRSQQPILEICSFVPFIKKKQDGHRELDDKYTKYCSENAKMALENVLGTNEHKKNEQIIEVLAATRSSDGYKEKENDISLSNENHGYLKLLKHLNDEQVFDRDFIDYFHSNLKYLQSDNLLNALYNHDELKPCFDLVVENQTGHTLKVLEISDIGALGHIPSITTSHPLLLTKHFLSTSNTFLKEDMKQKKDVEVLSWSPENETPNTFEKVNLVVADNYIHKQPTIEESLSTLMGFIEKDGFLLVKEIVDNFHVVLPIDGLNIDINKFKDLKHRSCGMYCNAQTWREIFAKTGLAIVYERSDSVFSTFLLKRVSECSVDKQIVLNVTDLTCSWVDDLKLKMKEALSKPTGENVWLIANGNLTGILGMVNCLKKEPGGERLRCILNYDANQQLNVPDALKEVLDADLFMNVYRNGQWGSYRMSPLQQDALKPCHHAFVNIQSRGDLSSLVWYESPLQYYSRQEISPTSDLFSVYYASLNFRDVMLATGKLPPDTITGGLENQDCPLGLEFSGLNRSGARVMGVVPEKALATTVAVENCFAWKIPADWSLEQAATVPLVYATAYYALVVRGNIRRGNKVLIHSGSGGVGQAAVSIALHYECEVFTTVGSTEKRDYLISRFPSLSGDNIFNSRDTSFATSVLTATDGKGVDIVLNSLSEEKLQASIDTLAKHGRFLEIGKFDLSNNTALGMAIFLKNISFHGVLLDSLFEAGNEEWTVVSKLLTDGIESGTVQPLASTVFHRDDVEAAFRFMAQGKHIGKVLVKIRDSDADLSIASVPRVTFDPQKCYIITGGLGGFGLELAQWLVNRGVTTLILTSRSGVKTGYQTKKIKKLRSYGAEVVVTTKDMSIEEDVRTLLMETSGKALGGVFHLAMVLKDGLFEDLDQDQFLQVCAPKVTGTLHLDRMTRELYKDTCDWFVVFSSAITVGRGNAGQSNYSFANSFMERICEQRRQDGVHGLAIQWGAIGDVGIILESLGNNETVVGISKPQRIHSCLENLDKLLSRTEPVVSSFVPAKKQGGGGGDNKADLVSAICHILGINNPSSVNPDSTLNHLGLDSLMGVEVKQTLERDYDITMEMKDIGNLTINAMQALESGGENSAKQ